MALVPRVMESTISDNTEPGHGFRGWHYAAAQGSLAESGTPEEICLDSGCSSTLIDKAFLQRHLPKVETYTRDNCPLTVRGIGDRKHVIDQYVHIHVFIRGIFQNQIVLLKFPIEANITEDLRANMLIGTDVLGPHQILLDIFNAKAIARTCQNATIPLRIRAKPHHTTPRPVYNKQRVIIPPFSQARLPIKVNKQVPEDRDSTFTPDYKHITLYNHVVDANFSFVHAINLSDKPVVIPRKVRLGTISDLDEVNAYMAHEDAAEIARVDQTNVLRIKPARAIGQAKPQDIEMKLPNGVTIYGNDPVAVKLAEVVNRYPEVWENPGGFANVPENEWMRVPLIDDWQSKIKAMRLGRVYSLGPVERQLVDEMFDKLHQQGRMQWASNHSPSGYPVFVAWRTQYKDGNAVKKGRVVVDIRNLNKITVPDIYPTPSQSDILAALANKRYISVVDAVSFFYQWRIHPDDRNRLTVVSHRGQETFNVAIMGYMNSAAYVQRQLDNKLRDLHEFVRAYIDDIIIFSDTLDDHLDHLDRLFSRLKELNIHLAPTKAYIGFPSVVMLGIRVDSLGLTTPEEKLRAIANLKFPYTLKQLETYLGFTGWMRQYIPRYAQVSEPLQERKHIMSQTGPNAGKARKQFAKIARNNSPSPAEYEAYRNIQCAFKNPTMLIHADKTRRLFIDLDAAKSDTGFGAIIYHVEGELDYLDGKTKMIPPTRARIQPILFLSRLLNRYEKNYWPTELEVACLVWVLKKVRHLIEAAEKPTIIWTDHAATISIAKQSSMSTTSTDKLNLRLIQAAQYIQQFKLELYHKPGKTNIVPDALSRLPADTEEPPSVPILDSFQGYAFTAVLVQMSSTFKEQLKEGYSKDTKWQRILEDIRKNKSCKLPYEEDNGLLYSLSKSPISPSAYVKRLCIPHSLTSHVFRMAHDSSGHPGFLRTMANLDGLAIPRVSRLLRRYIDACPQCDRLATRRHKPYGNMQPILSPPVPFHTIAIDFILALPESTEGFNAIMPATCKFTKRLLFIPGKKTYSAEDWAILLLNALLQADWGLPKVIISDRDRKFLSRMWKAIFKALDVELVFSTAYYPQTDGSSERTVQTAEIALRYAIDILETPGLWPSILPRLQAQLNAAPSATTGRSAHELSYGMKLNAPVDLVTKALRDNSEEGAQDFSLRLEAMEAINLAQMAMKRQYDRKHKFQEFNVGDDVMLRLHKGYSIPDAERLGAKFGPQYAGPIKVLERIGNLAYRLEIPSHWRIHPVISVAHLEPKKKDPFQRPMPTNPGPVHMEGDTEDLQSWEIEKLLNKRTRTRKGKKIVQYQVRWLGWGPEWDQWYDLDKLDNAKELVEEYEHLHDKKMK